VKIVLIGSGNIATFFGSKFQAAGFEMVQVISYHLSHAEQLAQQFACPFSDNIQLIDRNADVYLFAVKDDVLLEMAKSISLPDKLVIHTAGSIHLSELAIMSNRLACLWCVYSINKKELPEVKDIPLVVNYLDVADGAVVNILAKSISTKQYHLDDHQKSVLHLAAVFANNFTNHLFTICKKIVEKERVPFEILFPIISDTAGKALGGEPETLQTGPASRGDEETMRKHQLLLYNQSDFLQIYEVLSKSIAAGAKK
jgi:predicted short-subunit dehydrogenase-like oxidoreductase (DUF2520 family)